MRLNPSGVFATENSNSENFRWVSGARIIDSVNPGIVLQRLNSSDSSIFVNLCASLAPWVPLDEIKISVSDQSGSALGSFKILQQKSCSNIKIEASSQEVYLTAKEGGVFPSLFDRRRILYRIWNSSGDYFKVVGANPQSK